MAVFQAAGMYRKSDRHDSLPESMLQLRWTGGWYRLIGRAPVEGAFFVDF